VETPQQQRRPTVGQLAAALSDLRLDFDDIDLANILWLAQFTESAPAPPADPTPQTPDPTPEVREVEGSPLPTDSATVNLYPEPAPQPATEPATAPAQGTPFSVPAAPALRTRMDLARALRPLMRKQPSRTRFELDEGATVNQIADTQVWLPVVQPCPERWLELEIVVEASKTTVIWEQSIAELVHLAEYQGAFRTVRTWRLVGQGGGQSPNLQLFPRWRDPASKLAAPNPASAQRPHTPRELLDPTGRRLIWLVSDCTSALWHSSSFHTALQTWGQRQPLAIVQMFPPNLWSRTALRNGHQVWLSALAPGLPSARLAVEGLSPRLMRRRATLGTVPILSLEPTAVRNWSRVVAGAGDARAPGRAFDLQRLGELAPSSVPKAASALTAQARVDLFRATATSKTVIQLANLMAATPVSLPVVDLLREAFRADFAEEVSQAHVAEVLLSGLLRRCDGADEAVCRYEFWGDDQSEPTARVRDILLGDTSRAKTLRVLDVLSAAICRKLGTAPKSFQALLADLQGTDQGELRAAALPFAQIGLDVLRRLGGDHATLAQRYDLNRPRPGEAGATDEFSDFPFEDDTYEVAQIINFPALETCEDESATIVDIQDRFDFETATIARDEHQGWVITRRPGIAWGHIEVLEPASATQSQGQGQGQSQSQGTAEVRLEMVAIAPGSFLMGSPPDEPDNYEDEQPQHEVTVPDFLIARTPITQAQWQVVAGWPQIGRELDPDPASLKGENRPVEQVSWEDATEFCQRLSVHTGKTYRLPSEAEWEYACRAGTTTPFHYGETITAELANYDASRTYGDGPQGEYRRQTTEVGSFPANAWGLCDMHGNVREWCEDDWHGNYEGAPTDGSAWVDADRTKTRRLLRGGSWCFIPRFCRSAYRSYDSRDIRNDNFGFRVCCEPPGLGS
jgi:formylglycine-generating enzyme required for sulfatase activity